MTATARLFGQRPHQPVFTTSPTAVTGNKSRKISPERLLELAEDRRKYRRIKVRLSGRFMRRDNRDYPCYTNDVSAGGMSVSAAVVCEPGEYVVFYIEEIGRIEGYVVRNLADGFAIAIDASPHKRENLVASLTWILNRHEFHGSESRRHERHIPANPLTSLVREDGSQHDVLVRDLSVGGARIIVNASLHIGEKIRLGKSCGLVVRLEDNGAAVQFETK